MAGPWEKYAVPVEEGPWAKYGGTAVEEPPKTPLPTMGQVALNAVPKGVANFLNTPVAVWNLAKSVSGAMHPQVNEEMTSTPNYPMKGAEALGLVNSAYEPQTPGQRIVDTAIQTGVGTGLMPASGLTGVFKNVVTGLASGAAAQGTKEATDSDLAAIGVGTMTPLLLRSLARPDEAARNAVRDETLREAQGAGYVVPPSTVKPSFLNERLESIAGKAAVKQDATLRNQAVTNALVTRELGLPPNTPITEGTLDHLRATAAAPYREVAQLSPLAEKALDKLREVRSEAANYFRFYDRSADPKALNAAQKLTQKAEMYESAIDSLAKQSNRPDLLGQLQEARKTIAKTYDVERALNVGDANISAAVLGRALDKGKPLTGNLKTIATFAEGPGRQFVREGAAVLSPGVSGTDAAASALLGTMGYGAGGAPGLMAAGLPLLRGPARNLVLSPAYQRFFALPEYGGLSAQQKVMQALMAGRMAGAAQEVPQ